jgi:hypothetical protein
VKKSASRVTKWLGDIPIGAAARSAQKARSVLRLSITAPKRLNIPNCSNVSLTRDYAKWVNGRQDRLDKLVRDSWD